MSAYSSALAAVKALGDQVSPIEAAAYALGFVAGNSPAPAKAVKNSAFVFIKPHAVTGATKDLVKAGLEAKGITVCPASCRAPL
jgi:hypothetical protein